MLYWLEIAMPDGHLTIYEGVNAEQVMFLRNLAINAGYPTKTGKM